MLYFVGNCCVIVILHNIILQNNLAICLLDTAPYFLLMSDCPIVKQCENKDN